MSWTHKEYLRLRSTDPKTRECDCGRPAAVFRNNDFICARCAELESVLWAEKQAVAHAQKIAKHGRAYASPFDPSFNAHRVIAQ